MVELPTLIEIEPTQSCNLRCRMCHVSFMPAEARPTLDAALIGRLAALRGTYFTIGSGFEPMMNRGFAEIIRGLNKLGAPIELITNGTLLSAENVAALADADLRHITFSFDGITAASYEHIRRGAEFRPTIDAIVQFRERFLGRDTVFTVNTTTMRRNLSELTETVAFWDAARFDIVGVITMVIRENEPELIRESLYPVRDDYHGALDATALNVIENERGIAVTNPWYGRSPLRERFPENFRGNSVVSRRGLAGEANRRRATRVRRREQYGAGPGMSFPCHSPWSFARILPNADVQLCYQFTVGNLATESFESIWFGERAEAVRRRVAAEQKICEACDYFRFCISGTSVNDDDKRSYLAGPLLAAADSIDFASGTMGALPPAPPQLIEAADGYNIVRFDGTYLGVPHALGPIDLGAQDPATVPGLVRGESLRAVRHLVRAAGAQQAQHEPPQLIETLGVYNIVRFEGAYLGVPQALGPMDLSAQDLTALPGLLRGETLKAVRNMILAGEQASQA